MLLERKLVRAILEHLTVPTGLAFFLDRGEAICLLLEPSWLPVTEFGAYVRTWKRPVARLAQWIEASLSLPTSFQPTSMLYWRPPRKSSAIINPMMLELGSLQPYIPAYCRSRYEHRSDGARIYMHFREVLVIQWRRLVTNSFVMTTAF